MQLDICQKAQQNNADHSRHFWLFASALLACSAVALDSSDAAEFHSKSRPHSVTVTAENAIGVCWIEPDGTIVLDLRRTADGINISMPPQRYSRSHRDYATILQHVGPLSPGEVKLVKPWPDKRP